MVPPSSSIYDSDIDDFIEQYEREQQVYPQIALGFRFGMGQAGLPHNCDAAFNYYEPAAFETVKFVQRTHGLHVLEKKKLKLGSYILDTRLIIDGSTSIDTEDASISDIEELLEFRGKFGSSESLMLKGMKLFHNSRNHESYEQAFKYFERAFEINANETKAAYHMGIMKLLGLGMEQDIEGAVSLFSGPNMEKDGLSLNALGYIYSTAPDFLENNPARL